MFVGSPNCSRLFFKMTCRHYLLGMSFCMTDILSPSTSSRHVLYHRPCFHGIFFFSSGHDCPIYTKLFAASFLIFCQYYVHHVLSLFWRPDHQVESEVDLSSSRATPPATPLIFFKARFFMWMWSKTPYQTLSSRCSVECHFPSQKSMVIGRVNDGSAQGPISALLQFVVQPFFA